MINKADGSTERGKVTYTYVVVVQIYSKLNLKCAKGLTNQMKQFIGQVEKENGLNEPSKDEKTKVRLLENIRIFRQTNKKWAEKISSELEFR